MEMLSANKQDMLQIEAFYQAVAAYQIANHEKQWEEADVTWQALTAIYPVTDFYLYKQDKQIIAACLIVDHDPIYWPAIPKKASLYLHKLAVHPAYRHLGLGDEVVQFFIKQGILQNMTLRLDVRAYKHKLRAFYERNGFTLVRIASIFEDYDTALYHYQGEDKHE